MTIAAGSKRRTSIPQTEEECGYLLSGRLIIRHENENGVLTERIIMPGDSFHFPPGVVHQEEALEDCVIIEGSTPHFNDRVRMEKQFNLGEPVGLPTTQFDEIEEK